MTRLNELTIDSAKAPRLPIVSAAIERAEAGGVESMSGVRIQVAKAATITTPSVMAVFWTTESIVIRPPREVVGRWSS